MTQPTEAPEVRAGFRIPVMLLEGYETSDKRFIQPGALRTRGLPMALMATTETTWGHEGAELAGRITSLEKVDASGMTDPVSGQPYGAGVWAWSAVGEWDSSERAQEFARMVADRTLCGVSVDLSVSEDRTEITEVDDDGWPTDGLYVVESGEIMGCTALPFPAFAGAWIEDLDAALGSGQPATGVTPADYVPPEESGEPIPQEDAVAAGAWWTVREAGPGCSSCDGALAASADGTEVAPDPSWFTDPGFTGPTAISVDDAGRVSGHLALWGTCHTGVAAECVVPPRSATDYALFHVGAVRCWDGSEIAAGHLTLGGGHAPVSGGLGVNAVRAHYDDTGTVVADVRAGEDEFGIWVAGAMRPDVSASQLRAFRAAPLSGDWRRYGQALELIAALAVNVPGFPVPRVQAVRASGRPVALVAAGASNAVLLRHSGGGFGSREVLEAALRPLYDSAARQALARIRG